LFGVLSFENASKTLFEWDKCIRPQYKLMYSLQYESYFMTQTL
jgi:hypothetical protein